MLDHFRPLNQFRIPWKRYTPFRTCWSPFVAFYSIKFGQPGAKLEVRRQILCIKNYEKIRIFDCMAFWTNLCYKNLSQSHPTVQTLQDMWKSGCGLLHHQIWLTWVKIRGQKENFNSRCTKFAFWPLILPQANQIWCCKRPQPDFHMSLRVCTVGVTL